MIKDHYLQELTIPVTQRRNGAENDITSVKNEYSHESSFAMAKRAYYKQPKQQRSWVRSYMDGRQGAIWFWCMGFVQAIIDQAFSELGGKFTDFMPKTLLCDDLGNHATAHNYIRKNNAIKANPSLIKKGDIFLLKTSNNPDKIWYHTGIIINANEETIQTIEGNTDELGTSNGDGVYSRIRNFHNSVIDVVSVQRMEDVV
ncbi:MAG: CHAP domain-containing protein [Saprospiraceae bacterium]|nr:CHAP domain-containing protein [Candidatus Vicinibacter affinis]